MQARLCAHRYAGFYNPRTFFVSFAFVWPKIAPKPFDLHGFLWILAGSCNRSSRHLGLGLAQDLSCFNL